MSFGKEKLRRLENHGRALRVEHEHESLSAGWAGPRKWKQIALQCSEFVRAQLQPLVAQIRATKAQLDRLTREIEALVKEEKIPLGLGALTVSLLDGEVCNWTRFVHRKAVGSYTGCCPSEYSSGGIQRFGAIDRHGNKHVRVLLVEAVWRLLRWQPHWHARQKYLPRLKHGASLEEEDRRGPGTTTSHRSVALAQRPGHRGRTGLDASQCYRPDLRHINNNHPLLRKTVIQPEFN